MGYSLVGLIVAADQRGTVAHQTDAVDGGVLVTPARHRQPCCTAGVSRRRGLGVG